MEVWKKIEGFENYEVSNYGNVKRLDSLVYQLGKFYLGNMGLATTPTSNVTSMFAY